VGNFAENAIALPTPTPLHPLAIERMRQQAYPDSQLTYLNRTGHLSEGAPSLLDLVKLAGATTMAPTRTLADGVATTAMALAHRQA